VTTKQCYPILGLKSSKAYPCVHSGGIVGTVGDCVMGSLGLFRVTSLERLL
jgi:hypothetical protein